MIGVIGKFCTFATDSGLPKWKTFRSRKIKKLSETENIYL